MSFLDNSQFRLLENSLGAAALRQKVIANNIANVDTPNFKRSDVVFEDLLKKELSGSPSSFQGYRTNPRHLQIGRADSKSIEPQIVTDENTAMNNNMNNVDIDSEMSLLAKNQLEYNALIQQLNSELRKLRIVIDGRG